MIRLRSMWWKLITRMRHRRAVEFEPDVTLLRPAALEVHGSGRVRFGAGATVEAGARIIVRDADLTIGRRAYVGTGTTIVAFADVTIGDETLLGERVSIHSEDHGPRGSRQQFRTAPVHIGNGCWICAGAIVTRGSTIGDGSTVGANSVVTKDIPSDVLAAGVPARALRALS